MGKRGGNGSQLPRGPQSPPWLELRPPSQPIIVSQPPSPPAVRTVARRPTSLPLPDEVLLTHVLPLLNTQDLLSLSSVSKSFRTLAIDASFWRAKVRADFGSHAWVLDAPASSSANRAIVAADADADADPTWARRVYLGLEHARIFLWGGCVADDGVVRRAVKIEGEVQANHPVDVTKRMRRAHAWGVVRRNRSTQTSTSYTDTDIVLNPALRLGQGAKTKAKRERSVATKVLAGGEAFVVQDKNGRVWGFGEMGRSPRKLWPQHDLGRPIGIPLPFVPSATEVGERHALFLDPAGGIWEMSPWTYAIQHSWCLFADQGRPGSAAKAKVVNIAAGPHHSACLTNSNAVIVWFPFSDEYDHACEPCPDTFISPEEKSASDPVFMGTATVGHATDDFLHRLPPIPHSFRYSAERRLLKQWYNICKNKGDAMWTLGQRVVQIACGDNFVLALTEKHEVWIASAHPTDGVGAWQILPFFCNDKVTAIAANNDAVVAYAAPEGEWVAKVSRQLDKDLRPLRVNKDTDRWHHAFVRAGWVKHRDKVFTVARQVAVLCRDRDGMPLPIVKVMVGKRQGAALTTTGKMITWWRPEELDEDEEYYQIDSDSEDDVAGEPVLATTDQVFPASRFIDADPFVFDIAANGLHIAAIALGSPADDNRIPEPSRPAPRLTIKPKAVPAKTVLRHMGLGPRAQPARTQEFGWAQTARAQELGWAHGPQPTNKFEKGRHDDVFGKRDRSEAFGKRAAKKTSERRNPDTYVRPTEW